MAPWLSAAIFSLPFILCVLGAIAVSILILRLIAPKATAFYGTKGFCVGYLLSAIFLVPFFLFSSKTVSGSIELWLGGVMASWFGLALVFVPVLFLLKTRIKNILLATAIATVVVAFPLQIFLFWLTAEIEHEGLLSKKFAVDLFFVSILIFVTGFGFVVGLETMRKLSQSKEP
jgi:hypothetical protein